MIGKGRLTIRCLVILCLIVVVFSTCVLSPPQEEWDYDTWCDIKSDSRIWVDNILSVVLPFDSEGGPTKNLAVVKFPLDGGENKSKQSRLKPTNGIELFLYKTISGLNLEI
ncbi:MAG: hypothetical protein OEX77_01190 [Candidatus Bathyarchaeota archaeon]|nr:hypothetical protein [Candidatus Bathyarchaeota archaeon]MDH5732742.1 hypothetical protein [Candidatus Bathyarchaeota archaeon]